MVGYDVRQSQLTTGQYALAGAVSGIITRLTLQPLDVVKIRLQIQVGPSNKGVVDGLRSKYRGLFQSINVITKEEGIKALWKGHVPAQLLSITYGCVQFTTFEALTKLSWRIIAHERYTELKPATHFICGGLSGCCSSVIVQPIDVLRTRFVAQGEPKVYKSLHQAIVSMYHENGFRTFYKGLVPTLSEVFPQSGMYFAFYTGMQMIWKHHINSLVDSDISASESLFCGAMSGIFSKIIIHPLDVIKKRLQIDGFAFQNDNLAHYTTYSGSMVNCIKNITKHEGILGFYKGLKVNIIKGASSVGLSFMAYEQCCKHMLQMSS